MHNANCLENLIQHTKQPSTNNWHQRTLSELRFLNSAESLAHASPGADFSWNLRRHRHRAFCQGTALLGPMDPRMRFSNSGTELQAWCFLDDTENVWSKDGDSFRKPLSMHGFWSNMELLRSSVSSWSTWDPGKSSMEHGCVSSKPLQLGLGQHGLHGNTQLKSARLAQRLEAWQMLGSRWKGNENWCLMLKSPNVFYVFVQEEHLIGSCCFFSKGFKVKGATECLSTSICKWGKVWQSWKRSFKFEKWELLCLKSLAKVVEALQVHASDFLCILVAQQSI